MWVNLFTLLRNASFTNGLAPNHNFIETIFTVSKGMTCRIVSIKYGLGLQPFTDP